jgi:hypothetical protein
MPLIPAAALLAGRELHRLTAGLRRTIVAAGFMALAAIGVVLMTGPWFTQNQSVSIQQTRGIQTLAQSVSAKVGGEFPLTYVDRTFALQFFLGTMREVVAPAQAVRLLSQPTPAFVVVRRSDKLADLLRPIQTNLYEVARWPAQTNAYITVFSNHPSLEWTRQMAFGVGPFIVYTDGLRLKRAHSDELWFTAAGDTGVVRVTNVSINDQDLRLRVTGPRSEEREQRSMKPGETWVESIP